MSPLWDVAATTGMAGGPAAAFFAAAAAAFELVMCDHTTYAMMPSTRRPPIHSHMLRRRWTGAGFLAFAIGGPGRRSAIGSRLSLGCSVVVLELSDINWKVQKLHPDVRELPSP